MLHIVTHRGNVQFPADSVIAEHVGTDEAAPYETVTVTLADLTQEQIEEMDAIEITRARGVFSDENGGYVYVKPDGTWEHREQ